MLSKVDRHVPDSGGLAAWTYVDKSRVGDHIWWIGDNGRFAEHSPVWGLEYDVRDILTEMHQLNKTRWT